MIQILIKSAPDMDQVIHGVNNYRKIALYNLPLSIQILTINLFIACIGFIILISFNFFLINNDDKIQIIKINANDDLKNIQSFLEKNAIMPGIITTESGLQYRIITDGSGNKPTDMSTVEVHYVGRLLDGTEFDSSLKRGVPAQFGVTQVIPGWTEALKLMTEGSKWELFIPADLAYGLGGQGLIGPNAMLIFEVELLQSNITQ